MLCIFIDYSVQQIQGFRDNADLLMKGTQRTMIKAKGEILSQKEFRTGKENHQLIQCAIEVGKKIRNNERIGSEVPAGQRHESNMLSI